LFLRRATSLSSLSIFFSANAHLIPAQAELGRRVIEAQPNTIVVCVRNPYDVNCFPEASTIICTFGFRKPSLQAISRILAGDEKARGMMPVNF